MNQTDTLFEFVMFVAGVICLIGIIVMFVTGFILPKRRKKRRGCCKCRYQDGERDEWCKRCTNQTGEFCRGCPQRKKRRSK